MTHFLSSFIENNVMRIDFFIHAHVFILGAPGGPSPISSPELTLP